uniref:Uncharacterized protein n=1 Tax=Cacopsylla melanoneura TaxID=428564 RepID=A0A8D8QTA9_9HEMI
MSNFTKTCLQSSSRSFISGYLLHFRYNSGLRYLYLTFDRIFPRIMRYVWNCRNTRTRNTYTDIKISQILSSEGLSPKPNLLRVTHLVNCRYRYRYLLGTPKYYYVSFTGTYLFIYLA